jgi:Icc-related predicted phosphoesterase
MIQEVAKNIYHCQRGSLLNLNNINILFIGGAESVDKQFRTAGHDWFPEENITQREYNIIMNHPADSVDVVISHTCPLEFKIAEIDSKGGDSNRVVLSRVLEKYSPTLWYFGHWHIYLKGKYKNTTWSCLDRDDELNNFEILEFEDLSDED